MLAARGNAAGVMPSISDLKTTGTATFAHLAAIRQDSASATRQRYCSR